MTKRTTSLAAILLLSVLGVKLSSVCGTGQSAYASELTPVEEKDAQDLLGAVLLGCGEARSRVSSGVGSMTEYEWRLDGDRKLLEVEKEHLVVFSGDRCRVRTDTVLLTNDRALPDEPHMVPVPLGIVRTEESAYDGESLVMYSREQESATIAEGPGSNLDWLRFLVKMMAAGGPDPARAALGPPTHERRGPVVKGRQVADGVECVVVETVYAHTPEVGDGVWLADTFWISPEMGFAAVRMETRYFGGKFGAEGMLATAVTAQPRQCDSGDWRLSRMEAEQYALDAESGGTYLRSRTLVALADGFQINVPVTEAQLSIKLPSGTKVYNELIDAEYTVP